MGYYVSIYEGEIVIPKKNLSEAYKRMCALNDHDALKRGGQWGGDLDSNAPRPEGLNYHPSRWFSWMDADYPSKCADAKAVFDELGFDMEVMDNGDLRVYGYDNKTGQEDIFLGAISDLCEKGSFLVWRGEDGDSWRQEFGDTLMVTKSPMITWV